MNTDKYLKIAVLIHLFKWESTKKRFDLGNGISLCDIKGHKIEKLYHRECYENGIDHRSPYMFDTCILIRDSELFLTSDSTTKDPYSVIARLLNVIAIASQTAIDFVRVIISKDDFKNCKATYELDYWGAQSEFLLENHRKFNPKVFSEIKKMWLNANDIWVISKSRSRIINALTHFYYSWNVHYIEQTAIYISIVLENVFSPHSKDELSHQIAFNSSQFLGREAEEKKAIYKKIKKYYSVRSKIVHGEMVNDKDEQIIPEFFKTVCAILKKIILDKRLIKVFDDNETRKVFLEDMIFDSFKSSIGKISKTVK